MNQRNPPKPKRESKLRFEVLNAFVDQSLAGLTRTELAVWVILFRDTKPNGTARASYDDLARRAGCDRRSVARAIKRLKGRSMLKTVVKGGKESGPSRYVVAPYPMNG